MSLVVDLNINNNKNTDLQYPLFLQGLLSSQEVLMNISFEKNLTNEEKEIIDDLNKQIDSIKKLSDTLISDSKLPKFFIHLNTKFLQTIYKVDNSKDEARADNFFELEDIINKILKYLENLQEEKLIKEIRYNNSNLMSELEKNTKEANEYLTKAKVITDDVRNSSLKDVYDKEYKNYRLAALVYEIAFYCLIILMFLYFLGVINLFSPLNIQHGIDFYIQKISILVLSTTLAAFLLKRSFSNRKIAEDAFRTSKELVALPRFIEPLPQETQDKIRFDLAYKYFGNSNESSKQNDESNMMADSIKANTEFLKAMKEIK